MRAVVSSDFIFCCFLNEIVYFPFQHNSLFGTQKGLHLKHIYLNEMVYSLK